jgi:hypothetical protein
MRRKAVTKGVRGHRLAELGHLGRGIAGAPELARRHRVDRVHSGKQPPLEMRGSQPSSRQEQLLELLTGSADSHRCYGRCRPAADFRPALHLQQFSVKKRQSTLR